MIKSLKEHGAQNVYNCETHDIYYTNNNLDGLTENQVKNACVRLRNPKEDSIEKYFHNKKTKQLFYEQISNFNYYKEKFPNCYIANLDGKVIRE